MFVLAILASPPRRPSLTLKLLSGKEITYQEFKTQYLEGDQVENLIVANKKRYTELSLYPSTTLLSGFNLLNILTLLNLPAFISLLTQQTYKLLKS
jgi:hypothetical protein